MLYLLKLKLYRIIVALDFMDFMDDDADSDNATPYGMYFGNESVIVTKINLYISSGRGETVFETVSIDSRNRFRIRLFDYPNLNWFRLGFAFANRLRP